MKFVSGNYNFSLFLVGYRTTPLKYFILDLLFIAHELLIIIEANGPNDSFKNLIIFHISRSGYAHIVPMMCMSLL